MTFGGQRQLAGSMFALARKLPGACSDLKFHRRGNCSSRNHRMFPVVALSMSAVQVDSSSAPRPSFFQRELDRNPTG